MLLRSPRFVVLNLTLALLGAPRARAAEITVEMTASRFVFEPARIEVDQGDKVIVKLRSTDGVHGFAIKELKVKLPVPKGGALVTAEFVADKAGTFSFVCSEYCGSGHSRMKGVLVVRPKGGAQ